MQKYVKVRSTAREVLPMEIAEQIIYDKDEYIKVITEKSNSLEEQATNLQLALVDVYEMIL